MSKSHCYQVSSRIKNFFHSSKTECKWSLNSPEKIEKFSAQQEALRSQLILQYLNSKSSKCEYQDDSMAIEDTTGSVEVNIGVQTMSHAQKRLSGSMYTAINRVDSRAENCIKYLDKFDEADSECCSESGSYDNAYSDISIEFEVNSHELLGCSNN